MSEPDDRRPSIGLHPADALAAEHQVVLAVLDALDVEAARVRGEGRMDTTRWRALLDLLTHFVQDEHVAKEELLFDAMSEQGYPRSPGPIDDLERDHLDAEELLVQLRSAVAGGDSQACVRAARNFADFSREHVAREDNVLLAIARQVLRDEAARRALLAIERYTSERVGEDEHERRLREARRLCTACGVDFDRERHPPFDGRSGHC